ncbi:uncharacterized protein Z518_04003 [Rhinocladiella mackenziei CBS 650.93]|uniref:Methyltransferase type 11 domain-containing protein n=1 Tax=Rhinocladiella mackenziei CBS 650.93 TaxID=1442369 RepID=A0A0D2IK28_9EURO|nr:uncharacterized protein Z518_04003 [Rhinocladiella mackenziei CBS 650.93]KIX06029.1 hypothetical protein Z518_04003 [Rhinocladiella mackenziei CBS 650.93]
MSHRTPGHDTQQGVSRTRDATVAQTARLQTVMQDAPQLESTGPSASRGPTSQLPHLLTDRSGHPSGKPRPKPTAIPRSTAKTPSVRSTTPLRNVSSSAGTKSAGNSSSMPQDAPLAMDSSHAPRTKDPSFTTRRIARSSDASSDERSSSDADHDAIFSIVMPEVSTASRPTDLPPRLIPELQALASSSPKRSEVLNKSMSSISSPSTRLSNTPSPWSASTATTTPTSWSSASPGIVQQVPMKQSGKRSQTVPIPAPKREKVPKMPALPESFVPLGESDSPAGSNGSRKTPSKKRTPLNTPAPTPPPRTSSARQTLSRSSSRSDGQRPKPDLQPTPSPDLERSPLARRARTEPENVGDSVRQGSLARAHDELQQSLGEAPPRPSRQGTRTLGDTRPVVLNTHRSGFASRHREILDARDDGLREPVDIGKEEEIYPSSEHRPTTPKETGASVPSSPSRLGKFSRLGIFGRRGKSPAADTEKSPRNKLQRRGPAAGTGHEGYGKYGRRGRKAQQDSGSSNNSESERSVSSTRRTPLFSSKGKESRNSSRHNRSSQSDLDEFAATRLKPVPIIGGSGSSMKSNSGSRLDVSESPLPPPGLNLDQWRTPSQSQTSISQQSVQDSPGFTTAATSDQENVPTLALRRSQRFGNVAENFNLPTPIRTEERSRTPYISSQEESRSSALAASTSTPSTTTEFNRVDPTLQKSRDKKRRKLRWNIFRRKGPEPELESGMRPPSSSPEEMAVSVSSVPISRPMPYYAMMDSESEMNTNEQVGDFLSQVVESPAVSPMMEGSEREVPEDDQVQRIYEDTVFLPAAPVSPPQLFARPPPAVPLRSPTEQIPVQLDERPQRQPRLVRVGRIPPVVSRNERLHTPSRTSFSQPFVRRPVADNSDQTPEANPDPPLQISTEILPNRPYTAPDSAKSASAPAFGESEFLRFPSRQASEVSASSSSEGVLSILGPALIPGQLGSGHSGSFARQSDVYVPNSPSVDEVWNEYDDFIDQVLSPSRTRKSAKARVQQEAPVPEPPRDPSTSADSARYGTATQTESPDVFLSDFPVPAMKRPVLGQAEVTSAAPPVVFHPPTIPERSVGEDIRLRRSRIVSALHSSIDPASPFSIRDLLSEYESPHRYSSKLSERLSTSTAGRSLERLTMTMNAPDMQTEPNHQEQVALLDVVERSRDPVGQSELHYASLMVAKWLSFGRVLFSPAHDEIHTIPERHILVIDGLGNEDWSIYCAVTYEAQRAFVHDLKEKATPKGSKDSKPSQHAPDNHRRAEVVSFYERFPFPPAFFSAVVVRFPPAMAEAKLKNIISECRRVLLPGGYLELMLLDLDIVNMGVQTRRAVRELKFRMTAADKQISLRPIIDNVQNVLGGRGFSNISRCVVGVPVAGRPTGSTDSSSSSRSSGGSDGFPRRGTGDPRQANASPRMTFSQGRGGANLSLNDLIADHSENADAKIGKIVSRTARTWWQHCFEAGVIPDGNLSRSIFADKHVLGECKSRGSSFKMLIAYAQRPVFEARRRTMSEPVVPTVATAGVARQAQPSSGGSRTA